MAEEFKQETLIFGFDGLDLQSSLDKIEPNAASRLTNLFRLEAGGMTVRPGLTVIVSAFVSQGLTPPHTIVRLNDGAGVAALGFTDDGFQPRGFRFVAGKDRLFLLNGSSYTMIDSGYSGEPLITLSYRPPLSGQPWLFIADTLKMRKVRPRSTTTAHVLQLGLPQPSNPDALFEHDELPLLIAYRGGTSFALSTRDKVRLVCGLEFDLAADAVSYLFVRDTTRKTVIDTFDATTGWVATAGSDTAPATLSADAVDKKEGAASLKIVTAGGAAGAYYTFLAKPLVVDLSRIANSYRATDFDQLHFWAKIDRPDRVAEIRLYFVLSNFATSSIPGQVEGTNDNAFVLVFRPSDFTNFTETPVGNTLLGGISSYNTNTQTQQQGGGGQNQTAGLSIGRGVWTEFGVVGVPVLRGDPGDAAVSRSFAGFKRIGGDSTLSWDDVKGMCVVIVTNATGSVTLRVDDLYLFGGAGQDSSYPGNKKYNYRYVHYDPRTGAMSNPSDVTPEELWQDSVRTPFRLKPQAFGDAEIRQRFYRQGGALVQNWYFVGQNSVDGGEFVDDKSDNALLNAELLEFDNDQPVTTVGSTGLTIKAQPLPVIFGPVDDVLFALGDPNRQGNVYWCKPGEPDHWPARNTRELCGSSEELIAGCVWNNQPFAASRLRGFALFPNLVTTGTVNGVPLAMTRGPINRFCWVPADKGIAFVAKDGIYLTSGGPEVSITDEHVRPLFHGRTVNGYPPIDTSGDIATMVRLEIHSGELWVVYRAINSSGKQEQFALIYSFSQQYWRMYRFDTATQPALVYSEPVIPASLLVGGKGGQLWSHTGVTDAGALIAWTYRSGTLDQGNARAMKEYGDFWFEAIAGDGSIATKILLDDEQTEITGSSFGPGTTRQSYIVDPFSAAGGTFQADSGTRTARNISIELSGSVTSAVLPVIYQGGPSYLVHPEITTNRVGAGWDFQGRPTDKWVKGVMLECDTGGVSKNIDIQADGVTQTTISVTAAGRRSLLFSWAEFRGRLLRLKPTGNELGPRTWILWRYRWIFDEEPAQLTRWESQPLTYGVPGWTVLLYGWITLASTADVTLTLTAYKPDGTVFGTAYTTTLTSTGGVQRRLYVPFGARKGVTWKWLFTSSAAFWLYKPESEIYVQPWNGGDAQWVKPFGDDDLDGVRGLSDAGLGAERSGGGGG